MAEQIYFATMNAICADRRIRIATSTRTSSPTSTRRWSTATSATSRSSSRCPTAGRSTSSSRSCRSIGWTRSRRVAARCRTSPATPTARSTGSSARRTGSPSLELHEFRDGEPYILGIFLTGAYQEILGDLHNLFGDTNAVHIRLSDNGLRDHRSRARRHGDRGAELRAVPRVATCWRRSAARSRGIEHSRGRKRTRSSRSTWRGSRGTRTSRVRRRGKSAGLTD